ncbi:MAG: SDR family NAD(P)-dependent oxidoreductase [Dehalococcoidia bacterium]
MLDLSGKVALVTGAGSGIGRGIALAFARAGADLSCSDVVLARAEETAAMVRALGRRANAQQADVRDRAALDDQVSRAIGELGGIHIAVANAGIGRGTSVLTMSEEDYDTQFDVNTKGVFLTVQAAGRGMVRQGKGGRIIVISSIAGERPEPGAWAYCGSKAAVRMMARCWAQELSPFRITVNSVAPGFIDTPLASGSIGEGDIRAANERFIPMGRVGQPVDIGSLCCWLASDEAEYVTGTYNIMDGGLVDAGGWGMQTGLPSMRDGVKEMLRTMSGEQVLAAIDRMTADAMPVVEQMRREKGLQ